MLLPSTACVASAASRSIWLDTTSEKRDSLESRFFFMRRLVPIAWPFLFVLLLAALIIGRAVVWENSVAEFQQAVLSPATTDTLTPANLADDPLFLDGDAYYWCLAAERLLDDGGWRARLTRADNTPYGRENHWCSGPLVFLKGAATVIKTFSDSTTRAAIGRAALIWNPLVQFVLCASVVFLLWFRSQQTAAAVVAGLALAVQPSLVWLFHAGRPDHHALQLTFALLCWLLAYLGGFGWVTSGKEERGRYRNWWPILSGFCAGGALWSGALVATVALAGLGLGVAVVALWRSRSAEGESFEPAFWRVWGWAGGLTSLGFYLFEYAPDGFSWRLEANHPWYAVCLVAAGEFLASVGALRTKSEDSSRAWGGMGLAALVLLSLPLAVWWWGADVHAVRDGMMWRMHARITEFRTHGDVYNEAAFRWIFRDFGVFAALPLVAGWALLRGQLGVRTLTGVVTGLAVSLLFFALTVQQFRWGPFLGASLVFLAVVLIGSKQPNARISGLVFALLLLNSAWFAFSEWRALLGPRQLDVRAGAAVSLAEKKTLTALGEHLSGGEARFIGEMDLAPKLAYFANATSVGSFYWENAQGLADTAAFMTATTDDEALAILRERGITHVVIDRSPDFARSFSYIRRGDDDLKLVRETLAGRLVRGDIPPWLVEMEGINSLVKQPLVVGENALTLRLAFFEVSMEGSEP